MSYSSLKKLTRSVLPESLLYHAEPFLRNVFSIAYKGNKVSCPVCKKSFSSFIPLENGNDTLCPACGALPRNRLLWLYLRNELRIEERRFKTLHFSPARSIQRKLKQLKNLAYITTDFESNRSDKKYDITHIDEADNSYDLIICYHVLEHVIEDSRAMKELYRILKPGGIALLQVPWQDGNTYEDSSIRSKEERLKHFSQQDHVRIYGKDDFISRLQSAGFKVNAVEYTKQYSKDMIARFGLKDGENIFVCNK